MLLESTRPLVQAFDLALVDLDGVAYRGPEAIPHASESLVRARAAGMPLLFVTNNASREPGSVAGQLTRLGIPTGDDEVMTAAQAAAALLAERLSAGDRVLVVGGAGLVTAVTQAGFEVVHSADDAPVAVVQGFAPEVGWQQLAEAAFAVQRGAWYVASNRDLTLPQARGLAPGNGSLVAVVVAATGVEPVSAGKPEPTMFRLAAQRAGSTRPLVVGDRLDTDLAGARAADYPGLHVLTGVSSARDAVLARPQERPAFVGVDLRSLHEAHPVPHEDGGWTVCGDAAARVAEGALEMREGGVPVDGSHPVGIDVVRAACAAAWSAADRGDGPAPEAVPDLVVRAD